MLKGMLRYGPPWKLAVIGLVAILAGVALILVDWNAPELAKFVAMLLIARGALHIVTTSFEGVDGAVSGSIGIVEAAVGIVLLVWPDATLEVIAVTVGLLVVVRGVLAVAISVATRNTHRHWKVELASALIEIALGVVLLVHSEGTRATAVTIGIVAALSGLVELVTACARLRLAHEAGDARVTLVASV